MARTDHIVLCGGVPAPRRAEPGQIVRLDLGGDEPNVDLEIADISRRLSSDVPDVLTDLVEIASYVYCADQAVTRGSKDALTFPSPWRRHFIFNIPVRLPSIWSSRSVVDVLQKTLTILSEDTYEFHFVRRTNAVPMQQYLKLGDDESTTQELDEVILFSGGVDSLGGTVQEAVLEKRRIALVSHRSNPKVFSRQKQLVGGIRAMCKENPPLHIPVWVHQRGIEAREYTQRSRTFLYASLAVTVARAFGLNRIRFYENGVVGLNLPISEQVVGARATRTTHPQVLGGFANLFSLLVQERFLVENPFLWLTKTEVVNLIGDGGCSHLIQHSVSCMHTHEQTRDHPHCGRCSQCISRRYATLASRFGDSDPGNLYTVDLLTGDRLKDKDLTLVESFIRTATEIGSMNELQVVQRYGEVSRVVRHVPPLSANQVADKIVQLYRQHSSEVTGVMDEAFRAHASDIREGKLPATCAILLAIPETYKKVTVDEKRESSDAPGDSAAPSGRDGHPLLQAHGDDDRSDKAHQSVPHLVNIEMPAWLRTEARSETPRHNAPATRKGGSGDRTGGHILVHERAKGSMDRPSQTDPIWRITVAQKGPIPITRLSGEVVWIDPNAPHDPDDAVLTLEDEQRIAAVTLSGRSELRSELETAFDDPVWPPCGAMVQPFRRYATKVFDVNAAAYRAAASTQGRNSHEVLNAMAHNLLSEVFGSEWESSPGEEVTRTDWQRGIEGWKGREFVYAAGNDPDPNCLYHQVIGDAIKYHYRFHAIIPAPLPEEPPGINSSNLEWWKYIGLNERHDLAMAIKPYLEDRIAHWQVVYAPHGGGDPGVSIPAVSSESSPGAVAPGSDSVCAGARPNVDSPSCTPDLVRSRRTPDLDTSRARLTLIDALARELATIKQDLKRFCTAEDLKRKHPHFILWENIDQAELKELVNGDAFAPKAYAENLTLRKFGITSRETLKKDRKKLRQAQKPKRP